MRNNLFERVEEMFGSIRDEVLRVDKQFRELSHDLFKQYLQYLKEQKVFSEIPTIERADYAAFWEYREKGPDEIISHKKENPFFTAGSWSYPEGMQPIPINPKVQRGIRIYKPGGGGSDPFDYPKDKSLELYLLENGDLLECEVDNQMNETPMDPSSHTTTKTYTLTRTEAKRGYIAVDSFIQGLDILQLRDLFLNIMLYNKKYSDLSLEEVRKERRPEHCSPGHSRFRSDIEYLNGGGPYERPDGH